MAVKFGMTVLEIIGQLTRGFMKAMGRKPDGLEKIKIQQEAVQRFKDMNKVVDMEGNVLDPSKPIMGGTQEGAALKSGIMKATGAKPMSVKTKNRPDVYDLDDYDTTNMSDIKKEIIRTETKLGNLNPESEGFREKAKELVDKIEALKNKMRDDKATGGRIGYKIGSLDKARREFLKKAAGVGGGIAALKAGLLGLSKKAPEAVETVKETVKQAPDYFFALVDKIRRLGTMVDDAVADPRMERTYRYKNYELRENAYGTPDETVVTKIDDRGEFGYKEESMVYKKGGMTEEGRMADEYEEYTIRPDEDGKLKDIDTGIDDVSDIIREATDEAPSIKKAGGWTRLHVRRVMKFGPKEIKELKEYLRTGRNRKREFLGGGVTFASDLTQPEPKKEIVEIDAFNRFNRLYGKADGGRIGFSEGTKPFQIARGKRKGLYAVRSQLNVDDVANAVDSSTDYIYFKNKTDADNFYNSLARRGSETYIGKENFIKERKKFPKLNVDEFAAKMNELGYTDAGGKKLDGDRIRLYHGEFNVPLDKDAYKPKAPGAKKTRASDDPQRLKKIDDYVKGFEEEYGKKPTKRNVVAALQEQTRVMPIYEKTYGVTLPTGSGAKLTNVEKDINKILKNQKIIDKLDAGKFPTITDISRITGLDVALSETRLVDLAEKLRENPKYKKIADDYLDQPGLTNLDEGFGGRKRKRSRTILENRFVKLMGLDRKLPTLRTDILRKIQSFIPELKGLLAVDEIAGITTSMRRGSGPYAIFGQVLGGDFNTNIKGHGVDKLKGQIEKQMVNLKPNDPKRIDLQKRYNSAITEFENKANVDNPAKKVRGLKLSFKPPSETIKNKKIYNQYKDLFDTHYKTYGYSFEVPADRDSLVDISKKLDNKSFQNTIKNRFKKLISRGGKVGAGVGLATLAGTGFALADTPDTEVKSILPTAAAGAAAAGTIGTKPGRQLLGKAFRTLGTPLSGSLLAANQIRSNIQSGENVADAVLDPLVGLELSFPGLFKENLAKITSNPTAQKILRLGKFGRALTPIGAGITAAGLGIDAAKFTKRRIDELRSMTPEQRTELRNQGARQAFDPFQAAGGGIAKQAGDSSGRPPEKGPNSQGLPGLLKRVRNL